MFAIDETIKAIEDYHEYLINSYFKLPKDEIERLMMLFEKFSTHPTAKTRVLTAEIIRLLEKMLPTEETCNVDARD